MIKFSLSSPDNKVLVDFHQSNMKFEGLLTEGLQEVVQNALIVTRQDKDRVFVSQNSLESSNSFTIGQHFSLKHRDILK